MAKPFTLFKKKPKKGEEKPEPVKKGEEKPKPKK